MTTASGTVYFHYSGDKVVYETDESNNIVAEYTWDAQGNPVTMTRNGVTYHYHLNGHGDVVPLTDGSGNVVAEYRYDAWGNIVSQTGPMAAANPYRYAGYRYDEVTGCTTCELRLLSQGCGCRCTILPIALLIATTNLTVLDQPAGGTRMPGGVRGRSLHRPLLLD